MTKESPMELIDQLLATNSKSEWLAIYKKMSPEATKEQMDNDLQMMLKAGLLPQA